MFTTARASLKNLLPHRSVGYAFARATVSRHKLPPGPLIHLDKRERTNRHFLLDHAAQHGPIFKALAWRELWVCVLGLSRGRRLLREHGAVLQPVTLQLESLFPMGFLRQMRGEDHRHHRKALFRAIRPEDLADAAHDLDAIASRAMTEYASHQREVAGSPEAYIAMLNTIATGMLIRTFFGASPGSLLYERLHEGYRKLGPHGMVWNIGPAQRAAFAELRDTLLAHVSESAGGDDPPRCMLGRLASDGNLDATMLGNLIYMVEMGRYDTYSLFRWLSKYASEHPALLERITREEGTPPKDTRLMSEAFVLETLRTDQSERLIRRVERDFVFDGFLIPKHATLRVCLWESHKAPEAFPAPFEFNPLRFLGEDPTVDQFAPFGLDHHQCPLADMAIRTSEIFLRALARRYSVAPIADGLPVRGAYHWEPASRFAVTLKERGTVA